MVENNGDGNISGSVQILFLQWFSKKLISIPPVPIIIAAQLSISPLTGGWGSALATPLMPITLILVKELYIKERKKN